MVDLVHLILTEMLAALQLVVNMLVSQRNHSWIRNTPATAVQIKAILILTSQEMLMTLLNSRDSINTETKIRMSLLLQQINLLLPARKKRKKKKNLRNLSKLLFPLSLNLVRPPKLLVPLRLPLLDKSKMHLPLKLVSLLLPPNNLICSMISMSQLLLLNLKITMRIGIGVMPLLMAITIITITSNNSLLFNSNNRLSNRIQTNTNNNSLPNKMHSIYINRLLLFNNNNNFSSNNNNNRFTDPLFNSKIMISISSNLLPPLNRIIIIINRSLICLEISKAKLPMNKIRIIQRMNSV